MQTETYTVIAWTETLQQWNGERVFHRLATDAEIRNHFEEIHCPEGY